MSDLRLRTLGLKDNRLGDLETSDARRLASEVSHPFPEVSQSIVSQSLSLTSDV